MTLLILAMMLHLVFIYGTGSSVEYKIFRNEKTWSDAYNSCRRHSGYLVQNPSKIREQVQRNERVWIGQYASPWMWTRRCYKYQIQNNDRKITLANNSVSTCQNHCKTAEVWLQRQYCFCSINSEFAKLAEYKWCNETCGGDQSDVCGGAAAIMHYEIWSQYPTLPSASNGMKHCVSVIPEGQNRNIWQIDHCSMPYIPLCKTDDEKSLDDEYYVQAQRNMVSVTYRQNVQQCLQNMSMIADVSDDQKLSSLLSYLYSVYLSYRKTPLQMWVGLKRKRMKVSPFEKAQNPFITDCYYLNKSERETVEVPLDSCQRKMAYACEISMKNADITVPLLSTSISQTTAGQTTSLNSDNAPNTASIVLFVMASLIATVIITGIAVRCFKKKRCKSRPNKRSESSPHKENLGMDPRTSYEELGTRDQPYGNNYQQLTTPAATLTSSIGNHYDEIGP